MRFKKSIVCLLMSSLFFAIGPSLLAQAKENNSVVGLKSFDMVPEISGYSTFTGTAGYCRLDYMSGARCITWSIGLYSTGVASFSGSIEISPSSSSSMYYKSFSIYGTSGTVNLPYNIPAGSYSASIIGTAVGTDGKTYHPVSNARIPIYIY